MHTRQSAPKEEDFLKPMRLSVLGIVVAAVTAGVIASGAASAGGSAGLTDKFSLILMVHTLDSPKTTPWDGKLANDGKIFTYRSIACTGNAPVNNISSDLPSFNGRVAGSSLPNSLRGHPFAFRTVKTKRNGWMLRGIITIKVCKLGSGPTQSPDPVPDEQKPQINVKFLVKPKKVNGDDLHFSGKFQLRGGTGRYEGLTGSGQIAGYFLCFASGGCKQFGYYHDVQFVMHGTYKSPDPQLSQP